MCLKAWFCKGSMKKRFSMRSQSQQHVSTESGLRGLFSNSVPWWFYHDLPFCWSRLIHYQWPWSLGLRERGERKGAGFDAATNTNFDEGSSEIGCREQGRKKGLQIRAPRFTNSSLLSVSYLSLNVFFFTLRLPSSFHQTGVEILFFSNCSLKDLVYEFQLLWGKN